VLKGPLPALASNPAKAAPSNNFLRFIKSSLVRSLMDLFFQSLIHSRCHNG
jgi:hypothetical protein